MSKEFRILAWQAVDGNFSLDDKAVNQNDQLLQGEHRLEPEKQLRAVANKVGDEDRKREETLEGLRKRLGN